MVGGEPADLERARPVLNALASTVFHLGPLGTGAAMKLAVNTVIFGLNQAVAEGLVLAEASGIDRTRRLRRPGGERRRGSPYIDYKRASFLEPETAPVAFALDLAAKDLRLIDGRSRPSSASRCRRPRPTSRPSTRRPPAAAATVTSPRWPTTCGNTPEQRRTDPPETTIAGQTARPPATCDRKFD